MTNRVITQKHRDELKHYGVKGMKWGIRKDEPKGKGRTKRYSDLPQDPRNTRIKKLDQYKTADEFFGSHLGTKYSKFSKPYKNTLGEFWDPDNRLAWDSKTSTLGSKTDKDMLDFFKRVEEFITDNRGVSSFSELNKIPDGQNTMDIQADWTKINDLDDDPESLEKIAELIENWDKYTEAEAMEILAKYGGYQLNCTNCVASYELRRRGFDVEAMPYSEQITLNNGPDDLSKNYKNGLNWTDVPVGRSEDTETNTKAAILGLTNADQRGYVVIDGHIFNYEVQKGKVNWIDGQARKINDPTLSAGIERTTEVKIVRTDDQPLDDSILARVRNRDEE